jgi:hypothetical protein
MVTDCSDQQCHGEWQWLCGSGTIRKRESRRVEWCKNECASGSIDQVAIELKK